MSTRLIDPTLFTQDGSALLGSTCVACGTTAFPAQPGCSRCSGDAVDLVALPREGTLWAYTVQHFPPKSPYRHDGDFLPFGLGYIDLGDVVVESRLTVADLAALRPGLPVHLVTEQLFTDDDGTVVEGFAFAPAQNQQEASS